MGDETETIQETTSPSPDTGTEAVPPTSDVTVAHSLLDGLVSHAADVLVQEKLPEWEKHWHDEALKQINTLRQWLYKLGGGR